MVVGRGNDAIPTWSGFNYQGKMMLLYVLELINQIAKDKNKDSLMEIINKFRPLIKKQAYALNYEDAENDLIVDMIELIYNKM